MLSPEPRWAHCHLAPRLRRLCVRGHLSGGERGRANVLCCGAGGSQPGVAPVTFLWAASESRPRALQWPTPVLSLAESQLAAQLAQQPAPGPRLSTPLEVGLAGGPLHRLRRRLRLGRGLGHTRGAAATSSDRGIFHLAEWRRIVLSGSRVTLAGCATSLLTFCDNVISVLLLFITTGGFKQMM